MAKLDPGTLIQKTRELTAQSCDLCARSRLAVSESKRLLDRLALPRPNRLDLERRKRLLAK